MAPTDHAANRWGVLLEVWYGYWGGPGRMDCSGDCAHGRGDFYGEA